MIYSQIKGIIGCIEKATEINQQMIVQSGNAGAVHKATKLSELFDDIQVHIICIHSQYISLLNQNQKLNQLK